MELQEESPGLRAHLEGLQRAHCSLTSRFKQIEQKLDALDGLLCTDGNDSLEIVSKMFCQLQHMDDCSSFWRHLLNCLFEFYLLILAIADTIRAVGSTISTHARSTSNTLRPKMRKFVATLMNTIETSPARSRNARSSAHVRNSQSLQPICIT